MSDGVIRIKKESIWKYSTFLLAALLIVMLVIQYGGDRTVVQRGDSGNAPLPSVGGKVQIPISDTDVQIGPKDATVTVVEFADFSCPWCGAASGKNVDVVAYAKSNINPSWEPPLPRFMDEYVKTGKVHFVMKYYPGHGSGQQAHVVGWCLYEQNPDAFWKYHDLVYADQANANNLVKMKALAIQAGGDSTKLDSCLNAKKYDARLAEETALGRSIGFQGTPAFYVNGVEVQGGAVPYETLKKAIDAAK